MRLIPIVSCVLAALFPAAADAQIVDPGLSWAGSSGTWAGSACGGFTCTPHQVSVSVSEIVTVTVRGTYLGSWAIGLSASATQCLPVPGVQHALVLDFPITIAASGLMIEGDPILSCPGGRATLTFAFPFLPPGTTFAIQAVADLPNLTPSLTAAIVVTVQ
jgi:hypothetical protein